jgi:hypothetical protein
MGNGELEDGVLVDVENASCDRLRRFLESLAQDDVALRRYINDPAEFLNEKRREGKLEQGDVLLLLQSDYHRVQEIMSQCNSAARWIVIWIV